MSVIGPVTDGCRNRQQEVLLYGALYLLVAIQSVESNILQLSSNARSLFEVKIDKKRDEYPKC